jgi:hypothetical protein
MTSTNKARSRVHIQALPGGWGRTWPVATISPRTSLQKFEVVTEAASKKDKTSLEQKGAWARRICKSNVEWSALQAGECGFGWRAIERLALTVREPQEAPEDLGTVSPKFIPQVKAQKGLESSPEHEP